MSWAEVVDKVESRFDKHTNRIISLSKPNAGDNTSPSPHRSVSRASC